MRFFVHLTLGVLLVLLPFKVIKADSIPEAKATVLEAFLLSWAKKVEATQVPTILKADVRERRELIDKLNSILDSQGLPQINSKTDVKMKRSCIVGFVPDPKCFNGLEIEDKKNRFCLPCIVPHNVVVWSVRDKSLPVIGKEDFERTRMAPNSADAPEAAK